MTLTRLRAALEQTAAVGHCLVRAAIQPVDCEHLLAELAVGRFRPMEPQIGSVRQRGECLDIDPGDAAFPATGRLMSDLTREVRLSGVPGTAGFVPDEITCQRYLDDQSGIAPHMDQRRYRLLVAAFTLAGRATFRVFEDRSATKVVSAWTTCEGDLCLLRAPGLAGHDDGRPTHSVGGPAEGTRISLTARLLGRDLPPKG